MLTCVAWFGAISNAQALEVGLEVDACANVAEQRVRELTELELKTRVVPPKAPEHLAASVRVTCNGDQVLIRVIDTTTSKEVSRTFTMTEPEPDVRARSTALAAAELVLTSWMELVLAEPPKATQAPTPRLVEDRRAASALVRRRTGRGAHVDALLGFAEMGG
ncbi:MAG: hypothetical protein QM756_26240, partial [Polyangiaceae bacterium]